MWFRAAAVCMAVRLHCRPSSAQEIAEKAAAWAEKAAADIEAKDAELKALSALRDADLARLKELQARFDRDVALQAAAEVRVATVWLVVLCAC